jgi:hypothetical protein
LIGRSGIWENCRAAYEDIVKHLERYVDFYTLDFFIMFCDSST